jgi:peroxiredoxin Q/BCP
MAPAASTLKKGDVAPPFSLEDHEGKRVALADLKGQRVVLWFYPKADTPGCTREGCGFRDLQAEFAAKGATILGVSYDPPAENAAFAKKYRFAYRLLSDVDQAVAKAYGAWNPAEAEYPHRNTYVIGPTGHLEQVLVEVNAKTHPKSLLDAL